MTTPYTDIISKLEGATGPDREIDALIGLAFSTEPTAETFRSAKGYVRYRDSLGLWTARSAPNYTRSLDAALALVEERYPEAWITMGTQKPWCNLWKDNNSHISQSRGETLPLAVLTALFKALSSQTPVADRGPGNSNNPSGEPQ